MHSTGAAGHAPDVEARHAERAIWSRKHLVSRLPLVLRSCSSPAMCKAAGRPGTFCDRIETKDFGLPV
ncbi:hypothetical protein KSP40_PGU011808 [Platanthera guangdongensis]|uniref:Uncharacterized protein n=1 Tax=Platanthera guangdongensis TaxID=2320717 RepID=A0ABR2MHF3_9ASPA